MIDARGQVLDRVAHDADGIAFAEVTIRGTSVKPNGVQPRTSIPQILMWMLDYALQPFLIPLYRSGVRRQWGASMAPIEQRTKVWLFVATAAAVIGWAAGRLGAP